MNKCIGLVEKYETVLNEMVKYYPNKRKGILQTNFNSIDLIREMLLEFKPEYTNYT